MRGRWIEYGAWLTGIVLLTLFGAARLWAENERVRGLEALRAMQSSTDANVPSIAAALSDEAATGVSVTTASSAARRADVDQTLWSEKRAREYAEAVSRPGRPSGALRIPSISLEVPVYPGVSELNLNRGAAHIDGTAPLGTDGNAGIAAHRDGFFRRLESLRIDADVFLEVDARTLRYRVVEIQIVEPTDVHVLSATEKPSVTLVTCYPFYFVGNAPERYIVRAELVDPTDVFPATSHQTSAR